MTSGPKPIDITGNRYGRLVANYRGTKQGKVHKWVCTCDCGIVKEISVYSLTRGKTNSCGCLHREIKTVHGG